MRRIAAATVMLALGCTQPPSGGDDDPRSDGKDDEPADTDSPLDTSDTDTPPGTTGDTGSDAPWLMDVDCSQLLPIPVTYESYSWVPAAEDFTFSADGYLYSATGNVTRTAFGGPTEVLVPNVGAARGTRFLPDGTLVTAQTDTGAVVAYDPAGGQRVLASGLANPNGIAIGADGRVYVATFERILRIDPDTGVTDTVVEMANRSFDGLTFDHDYSRLFFNEELGRVHWVDLAPDGTPGALGGPIQMPIGGFSLLDGMALDACGNLYVTEMGGRVWRVDPAGAIDIAVEVTGALAVIPAVNFGPGVGGFERDTLYVLDFLGKAYAARIGVPGKWEPHYP